MQTFNFNKRTLLFIAIFAILGFILLQVPVAQLAGSGAKFTLFDAFGPIATSFIGTVPGVIAVFLMQLFNFLVHGAKVVDAGTIIRFFPMLFAAWYFGSRSRVSLAVPVIAIIAFIAHPVGRTVWYFSLFWTIPLLCYFWHDRFLLARSFGATFTAHSVGGALWIWAFSTPAGVWQSLIPVVVIERTLFAVGIALTYLVMNNVLHFLMARNVLPIGLHFDTRHLWGQPHA